MKENDNDADNEVEDEEKDDEDKEGEELEEQQQEEEDEDSDNETQRISEGGNQDLPQQPAELQMGAQQVPVEEDPIKTRLHE